MIHITVRGGVVVEVKKSTNLPDHCPNFCVITDYDNKPLDDTFFFPIDPMKEVDAIREYAKADRVRKEKIKEASELSKTKMRKKGWHDAGGEAL